MILLLLHSVSSCQNAPCFCANILLSGLLNTEKIKSRCVKSEIIDTRYLSLYRRWLLSAAESMLPTCSSGYTVLSLQWRLRPAWGAALPSEREAHRATPCGLRSPFSDSIGVACNRLLILARPAALCVLLSTWQWGRSQELGRPQAAALPLIRPRPHRSSISQKGLCNAVLFNS